MIILTGEPGIGKTALLRAVVEQASRSGSMVGLGHAEEIDQIAPGAPLLLALRSGPRPLSWMTSMRGRCPPRPKPERRPCGRRPQSGQRLEPGGLS